MPDDPHPTDRLAAADLLRRALDDPAADFRPGQWEAIDALVNRAARLLVVQRTGWGKSSVYFTTTRLLRDRGRGPTLIISPLLALMRNQVEAGERLGVTTATVNSANVDEWDRVMEQAVRGEVDALLISPERLSNDTFVQEVLTPIAESIGLFVVDEAHCISDWGHDFRPDYRRLVNILRRLPTGVPILGTTATANQRVIDDIVQQLGDIEVSRGPLMRDSLRLAAVRIPAPSGRLAWLAEHLPQLPGTGIVYVLTKRDAEMVAAFLRQQGLDARAYYSGVTDEEHPDTNDCRLHLERELLGNRLDVLVATSALGMGYDKPDLGFVVHYQLPDSVVSYYQQVGRAGRAIEAAYGVLLSGSEDARIHEYFRASAFPAVETVQRILDELANSEGLSVRQLTARVNESQGRVEHALKYMSVATPSPVIKQSSKWKRTPVPYTLDVDTIERLTGQREQELQEMQAYLDHNGCRMQFLARALDDPAAAACGKCDGCLGRPIVEPAASEAGTASAAAYLRSASYGLEIRKQIPAGCLPSHGLTGNLKPHQRAEPGRTLSRWGDGGWGAMVAADVERATGVADDASVHAVFRDELLEAAAALLDGRWRPQPTPTWVTWVPSQRRPGMGRAVAERMAARLAVPCVEALVLDRPHAPQADFANSAHQCRNLDGVFRVDPDGWTDGEPVLLVDDFVDSRWTMTVAAALLRGAGAGPVHPFAMAARGG